MLDWVLCYSSPFLKTTLVALVLSVANLFFAKRMKKSVLLYFAWGNFVVANRQNVFRKFTGIKYVVSLTGTYFIRSSFCKIQKETSFKHSWRPTLLGDCFCNSYFMPLLYFCYKNAKEMIWQLLLWLVLWVPSIYPLVKMFASRDLIVTVLRVPSIYPLVKMFASWDLIVTGSASSFYLSVG